MNYLQDRKIKRRRLFYAAFAVIIFALFFYFRVGILSGLSYVASGVFRPVIIFGNFVGKKIGGVASYFAFKSSMAREIQALNERLEEAEGKMIDYDLLREENASLKEILGRKDAKKEMVLAAILAKPNVSAYDTLLVDAGESEGIEKDAMVFALGNVPIGRVSDVYPNSSKVILFSSAGVSTDGFVTGKNISQPIIGRGGGNFEMILPRNYTPVEGDEVTLPGIMPQVIAAVQTIISDPRDPFVKALLVSPVNIQELKFVTIDAGK